MSRGRERGDQREVEKQKKKEKSSNVNTRHSAFLSQGKRSTPPTSFWCSRRNSDRRGRGEAEDEGEQKGAESQREVRGWRGWREKGGDDGERQRTSCGSSSVTSVRPLAVQPEC